jgi:hypothetical protein
VEANRASGCTPLGVFMPYIYIVANDNRLLANAFSEKIDLIIVSNCDSGICNFRSL